MEAIRKQLMSGTGKLDKKAYKFAVEAELNRLFYQLIFLTFMSFLVAFMLFISLVFDIYNPGGVKNDSTSGIQTMSLEGPL